MAGWQTMWHRHPGVRTGDELTFGERAADRMRQTMGSWPFVFGFLGFMGLWIGFNAVAVVHFDPFPYILLNLMLSTLAGLQAAMLLIAAKRADQVSSEVAVHTAQTGDDTAVMASEIKALLQTNTELTKEVHRLSMLVTQHLGCAPAEESDSS